MKSAVLSNFTEIYLPLIALILFVSVFVCMLFHVSRKRTRKLHSRLEMLPLEDGE